VEREARNLLEVRIEGIHLTLVFEGEGRDDEV